MRRSHLGEVFMCMLGAACTSASGEAVTFGATDGVGRSAQ